MNNEKILKEVWTGHDDLKILIPTSQKMKPIVEHIKNKLVKTISIVSKKKDDEFLKLIDKVIKNGQCPDCDKKVSGCKCNYKDLFVTIKRKELRNLNERGTD